MTTTLHKWFLLVGLDDTSDDTTEVEKQSAIGQDLLDIADVHLTLLTNGATLNPDIKANLQAQMAAELYEKRGRMGVTQNTMLGEQDTIIQNYSALVLNLIASKKRIRTV